VRRQTETKAETSQHESRQECELGKSAINLRSQKKQMAMNWKTKLKTSEIIQTHRSWWHRLRFALQLSFHSWRLINISKFKEIKQKMTIRRFDPRDGRWVWWFRPPESWESMNLWNLWNLKNLQLLGWICPWNWSQLLEIWLEKRSKRAQTIRAEFLGSGQAIIRNICRKTRNCKGDIADNHSS